MPLISSTKSAAARRIRNLQTTRGRRETGHFITEGAKLVLEALDAGIEVVEALANEHLDRNPAGVRCRQRLDATGLLVEASNRVMQSLASTESHQGVIAVMRRPQRTVAEVIGAEAVGTLVLAVQIAEPGNLGAMIRIAEAFGARGLIAIDSTDAWNPKTIRGAAGSSFRLPVAEAESAAPVVARLAEAGYRLVATVARGGARPTPELLAEPVAVAFGSEAHGLADGLVEPFQHRLTIPLAAPVESLNVAAATAVVLAART